MSDGPTHGPDLEARRLSAALALARDVDGADALLARYPVRRDRLDPDTLARIGEDLAGPPVLLDDGDLVLRVEANRETSDPARQDEARRKNRFPKPTRTADATDAPTLGAVPDYPTEVLPAAARKLVELGAKHGLPPALVGGAGLAALATALGSGPEIQAMPTWHERAILWVSLIAPAGAGKSPAQQLAYGPLRDWDNSLLEDDHPLLLGDLTLEALARHLNEEDSAALDIDELSQQLRGLGEYKRGGGGDRGRFLSLWTGHPRRFLRVGGGGKPTNQVSLHVARPTVVICGGLQTRLHELLGGEEDGMRPRWLPHLAQMPEVGHLSDLPVPAGWEELLTGALLPLRNERRTWTLSAAARVTFGGYRDTWKRQARETSGGVSAAQTKADVHLLRVALVFAEADNPGAGGEVGADVIDRAAAIVDFVLDGWYALPEQGSLALSRRDERLDEGVERLRTWLEEHGGKASRRELQQRRVAGARAAKDLDQLLERYEDTFPGCVTRAAQEHGGLPTVVVRAPARRPPTTTVLTAATTGGAGAASPRPAGADGTPDTVAGGGAVAGATPLGQSPGVSSPETTAASAVAGGNTAVVGGAGAASGQASGPADSAVDAATPLPGATPADDPDEEGLPDPPRHGETGGGETGLLRLASEGGGTGEPASSRHPDDGPGGRPLRVGGAHGLLPAGEPAERVASALGNGKPLLGAELLAETHRIVARAEAAVTRATCRWDREHRPDDNGRCSVCGSEKVVQKVVAGVTYLRCGHSEVLP